MQPQQFLVLLFVTSFVMFATAYIFLARFRLLIDILCEYFALLMRAYVLQTELAYLKLKYRMLILLRKMLAHDEKREAGNRDRET